VRALSGLSLFLLIGSVGAAYPAEDFCCGSIFPTKKTQVRLESEDVKLQLQGGDAVEADCAYRLANAGGAASLELGLPFRSGARAALGIGEDEPDSIHEVELEVDGNQVEAAAGPHDSRGGRAAYFWTPNLEPQAVVELRIGYNFNLRTDENGVSHLDYAWSRSDAWGGGGSADLDVDLGRPFPACYLSVSPTPQTWEGTHLHWSLTQPTGVSLSLDQRRGDLFAVLERKALAGRSLGPDEALMLKNTVFALRGKVFPSRSLNRHFMAQDWYKPRPDYSDKLLTPEEWEVVAALGRRGSGRRPKEQ
jgi:hypothetical protein